MNILALDTSTEYCSAALLSDAGIRTREERAGQRHSELLLPMVEALLQEAGTPASALDAVAFGAGPGSFTGLRIACGVAQGLGMGLGVPVVPVGTLLALAQASGRPNVIACLDARMGEVYHAAYRRTGDAAWEEVLAPSVCPAAEVPLVDGTGWHGAGSGFATYGEALARRYGDRLASADAEAWPRAAAIAELAVQSLRTGGGLPAEQAVPVYVRDRVALKMHERP